MEAVLDAGAEERERTLQRECGDDAALRKAAEEILDRYSESDDLLGHEPFRPLGGEREQLAVGTRVGAYRIERELGRGSMGRVYLAERADGTFSKTVALKAVRFAGTALEELFRSERRILAGLEHGNIARLYDGGSTEAGGLYLVMEFVSGQPLDEYCRQHRLSVRERLQLFLPIAQAVEYAHRRGVLHRDLKPTNILVDADGHPKLLDFGIAGLIGEAAHGFTPRYASPEQREGGLASERADIYSLGVMLAEVLVGDKLPADLASIAAKAQATRPEDRYASAREFGEDIANYLAVRPVAAYAGKFAYRCGKFLRRKPGVVAVALTAVLAAGLYWATRPEVLPSDAKVERLTSLQGRETNPSLAPDGKQVAFASRASGNWDIYVQSTPEEQPRNLTASCKDDDTQPAFSPDGKQIAFRSQREGGGIFVLRLLDGSVRKVADGGFYPAWSPDGKELVVSSDQFTSVSPGPRQSQLWAVNVATGKRRDVTNQEMLRDAVQGVWSPNGKRIAFWGFDGNRTTTIWSIAASGGTPVPVIRGGATRTDGGRVWAPFWSPKGKHLYFTSDRSGVPTLWRVAVDPDSGETRGEPVRLPLPLTQAGSFSLSRDGKHLAYTVETEAANIFKLGFDPVALQLVGKPRPVTIGENGYRRPRVSPDGENLVFESAGNEDLWTCRSDGSGLRALLPRETIGFPRFVDNSTVGFLSREGKQFQVVSIRLDGTKRQSWVAPEDSSLTMKWLTPQRVLVAKTGDRYFFQELGKEPEPMANPLTEGLWMSFSLSARGERRLLGRIIPLKQRREARAMIFDMTTRQVTDLGVLADDAIEVFQGERYLLYKDFQHVLRVLDRKTGKNRELLRLSEGNVIGVELSQDQRWLYYSDARGAADVWVAEMASPL